jgi:aerobic-type carbon monoxide dehydrogenase small subunit (CoxS/CutS family)
MSDQVRITRRGLFRGLGSTTLIAGCRPGAPESVPPMAPPDDPSRRPQPVEGAVGPGPAPLQFTLNGKPQVLEVAPHVTLLEALRLHARATGTKVVCDRGSCGACTVMIDGAPRNSCMTLAHDVQGQSVTTVEGLARGEELSSLQKAFIEHDALQCGYCTPGMLISCQALIQRKGKAVTREDAEQAVSGNLCRCGTYPHVVAAVLDAAGRSG